MKDQIRDLLEEFLGSDAVKSYNNEESRNERLSHNGDHRDTNSKYHGMDEGLLNDLLECSVCLERLDTSSRVLPCQHTFCLKCLKEIVDSHKELRCPECRVLVETKVEELPPNVLLMRILEGMRNSAPRVPITSQRTPRSGHSHQGSQQGSHSHQVGRAGTDGKQLPPHGRAIYDYISKEPGDLSFKKGEVVLLQKKLDPFWYQGDCSGRTGVFPITYVQVVIPLPTPSALCKALYDFRMSAPDEEGCLAFDKGAIITVHRRVDENWAEGRLEERVGIFPIAFVELNQGARQLMNSSTLNRPVPPIPDGTRPSHSDHRHHSQHTHRYQPMSISTPASAQINFQNLATMSQSHPNYHQTSQTQIIIPQSVTTTLSHIPRNIMEPAHNKSPVDLIHFTDVHNKSQGTLGLQTVTRIAEPYENRLRTAKYENYSTPVRKAETVYQNIRTNDSPVTIANFNTNNVSSDSSSSVNTPAGVSSTTTPNTSSDTSSESAEPSTPSSPDNHTENVDHSQHSQPNQENSLNASMGVLSLNESSTATNTSLNVTLPAESPKPNAGASNSSGSQNQNGTATESPQVAMESNRTVEAAPCSSKSHGLRNGPDSLLNFGLGLQAALSPSHGNLGSRSHREHHHREKEKRNSLTQSHLQTAQHSTQNRHSTEILATSLLDHAPERDRERGERERRRRRSRSNERPLPAAYVALYPYKPQKADELELKKGGIYMVSEKCRDGWYKGCSERTQRCGVFPGNYVAAAANVRPKHDKVLGSGSGAVAAAVCAKGPSGEPAPDAPPRALTPPHHHPHPGASVTFPWNTGAGSQQATSKIDKTKEKSKQDKSSISGGVSLMKRLAAMKKCKSPPPVGYSMDNPVFEDGPGTSLMLNLPSTVQPHHPVHVRSGSCPSQLLRSLPTEVRATGSHRLRPKERPSLLLDHRQLQEHQHLLVRHATRSADNPWQSQHRKSQSLDVTVARKDRHHSQPVKERFRCIVAYPPNSEYELELKVDDIVLVHRKRGDGWYKGTLQRTGRTGLFPASFVQSCPAE